MFPQSSDSAGSSKSPEDPQASLEELYWDIDSGTIADPGAAGPAAIEPGPRQSAESPGEEESAESAAAGTVRDRSRSLRKPRSEPLPFHAPGQKTSDPAERAAEAPPLPAVNLAPRPPRAEPIEKAEAPPPATKMPLQRKSGEGVEKFTRFTTRPESSVAGAPQPPERGGSLNQGQAGGLPFGKLKENSSPGYQPSRLQEVIDHTYTHNSHRRMGHHGRGKRLGSALFAITVTGLVAALVWTWTRKKPEGPGLAGPAGSSPPVSVSASASAGLPPMAERQEAVRAGLQALLRAPDVESKLPWVLHPERLSGRMKDFYLAQKGQDPEITGVAVSQPVLIEGAWWFLVNLAVRDGSVIRIAARETAKGPQFDWENLVAYGSMPFATFCSAKPQTPQTLRLEMQASTFYQGKYTDTEYLACRIAPRGGTPVLNAYAPLSSPAAAHIRELTSKPGWNPSQLSVHWEANADVADAVLIDQASEITPPGTEAGAFRPVEKSAESSNKSGDPAVESGAPSRKAPSSE